MLHFFQLFFYVEIFSYNFWRGNFGNFLLSNSWYFAAKPQQRDAKRTGAFSKRYNNLFHPKYFENEPREPGYFGPRAYLEKQRAHGTRVVALSFACSLSRVSPTRLLWKLAPRLVQLVIIVNENWLTGDFTILAQHHNPTSAPQLTTIDKCSAADH